MHGENPLSGFEQAGRPGRGESSHPAGRWPANKQVSIAVTACIGSSPWTDGTGSCPVSKGSGSGPEIDFNHIQQYANCL